MLSLGELAQGRATLRESLSLFQEGKDKQGSAYVLDELARGAYLAGDFQGAAHHYAEALPVLLELGDKATIVVELAGLAGVAAALGRYLRAARLCGAMTNLCAKHGISLPPHHRVPSEQAADRARAYLGEAAFLSAWASGESLSLEQAVAYALEGSGQ